MLSEKRSFSLSVWGLATGYFAFYLPYCALVKATTMGLLPGVAAPSGFEMLPATGIATVAAMLLIITLMGWWKHSGRRQAYGLTFLCPTRWTLISGLATAAIIYTTTLVYTFRGVSILLAMLLLRGGVLMLAPTIDTAFKRRVRWFSWAALGLSLLALGAALWDVSSYHMTLAVAVTVVVYLAGYAVRLPCINRLAKSTDRNDTYRYFVEEQMVAMVALIAVPGAVALIGSGSVALELRHGFTSFFGSVAIWPALLIGVLYAGLCFFGTLIYLDRRENTFCIPLNRCSSLLAAIAASYALTFLYSEAPLGSGELAGAALIITAILLLSPLHHFRRQLGLLERLLSESQLIYLGLVTGEAGIVPTDARLVEAAANKIEASATRESEPAYVTSLRKVFLFVCNGNTGRSPMAQAICSKEIARRLGVSIEELSSHNVQVLSAGLRATPGSPMKRNAQIALQTLQVSSKGHSSQSLTADMVEQAERIFCMTEGQRRDVIGRFLAPPERVLLLDPMGFVEEPAEGDSDAFVSCAERIRILISKRLDELGITASTLSASAAG
jgi:protein-tyrosine-phosphatase